MFTRVGWSLLLVCCISCRAPSSETPARPVDASPIAEVTASAKPTAVVPEPPKSRFSPVARIEMQKRQAIELHPFGSEVLLDAGEGIFVTKHGVFEPSPRFQQNLPVFYGVTGVAGTFPDDAWVATIVGTSNSGQGEIYRFADGWKREGKPLPETWTYAGLADYGNGRKVALAVNYMYGPRITRPYFQLVSGKKTKLPELTAAKPGGACTTRIQPQSFVGFPSGRMLVYGSLCDTDEPALEVFEPGSSRSTIRVIESFKGSRCSEMGVDCGRSDAFFAVVSENDIWLAQTDRIVHFDGTDWTPVELPVTNQPVVAISAAGSDAWLVAAKGDDEVGELWRRSKGSAWVRELLPELPAGSKDNRGATDVVALGDVVWITAERYLLRSNYAGSVVDIAVRDWSRE